jgi:uncharacterized protein YbaP (TraB family)
MKTLSGIVAALALLWASCGPAAAETSPPARDPEAVLADELLVRARVPGPAWWKVSNGESTVWILGAPTGLPKGVTWNEKALKARLAESNLLILPPDLRPGPFRALTFFLRHGKEFRSQRPVEQTLPEPLARRFAALREKLGKPASRYAKWRPALAGLILAGDALQPARIRQGEPQARIESMARAAGVRTRVVSHHGGEMLDGLLGISDEAHQRCLQDMLDEAEAGPQLIEAASQGWTVGDLREALNVQRGFDHCLASLPGISALLERGQADTAAAIREALARPGHAVALVDLRSLLARGGVVERLRAQGFTVQTPDRLD